LIKANYDALTPQNVSASVNDTSIAYVTDTDMTEMKVLSTACGAVFPIVAIAAKFAHEW
jgi:hypothetical protein